MRKSRFTESATHRDDQGTKGRIATRFEKHAANFLAAVALASARIWLRSIETALQGSRTSKLIPDSPTSRL